MEIRVDIKVTAEEFFDFLVNQVKTDVVASTELKEEDIELKKGFSYTKKSSQNGKKAKITITKFEPLMDYASRYESENFKKRLRQFEKYIVQQRKNKNS